MVMVKEKAAKLLVRIAEKAARDAACAASPWDRFQPRESARVREWAKKQMDASKF